MPKIAAASEYAEQLAREIKGEAVSREIYAKLRTESPNSVEAKRLAAYWNFPSAPKPESLDYDETFARRDAKILGYLYDEDRKSTCLNSSHSQISYAVFCL